MSKLRQRQRNIHTKRGHKDKAGIHTVCAWSDWEWSMQSRLSRGPTARIVSGFHCICFAPGENSLWGGSFLCSWESQMDQMEGMKTVEPHLLPFPSDPVPALWNRKPAPWFFPPEKGLDAPPVFFRGGWLGGCRWAFTKRNVCKSILWINIKQNKVIEKNISEERSSHTQLSREKKEGLIVFSPLQYIALPPGTLRGVCLCLWSCSPVPLLLRHCGDWGDGDRTWIWLMGWRRAHPFSTYIPQI